jgi:hypothetical protein
MNELERLIHRREAIRRVGIILGSAAFVGGTSLLTACERERPATGADGGQIGDFTAEDIAYLDEIAETMLPETSTPGAKAAKVGAFMALMVTDTYEDSDRKIFRDGMRTLDEGSRRTNNVAFMSATPQQRLALLETVDKEQKQYHDDIEAKRTSTQGAARPDVERTGSPDADPRATLDTAAMKKADEEKDDGPPRHYFRMMKELALLGYFTSEIGYTQAMRYAEAPGRFDPCVPYTAGEKAWAPHA